MTTVQITKHLQKGHAKGAQLVHTLTFKNLADAQKYVAFLNKHTKKPIRQKSGHDFTVAAVQILP